MSSQSRTSQRANKKMDELLSSFDVLSTQLVSSFSALASALSSSECTTNPSSHKLRLAKAHVAVILGPSPTSMIAARARVALEIDGLRVFSRKSIVSPSNFRLVSVPNERLKENAPPNTFVDKEVRVSPVSRAESRGPPNASPSSLSPNLSFGDEIHFVELPPDSDSETESDRSSEDSDEEPESCNEIPAAPVETEAGIVAAERALSRAVAVANADPELGMTSDLRA